MQILVNINSKHAWKMHKQRIATTSFFYVDFSFSGHSRITGPQGKGKGISLTCHYHFHLLHRHLDISRTITSEDSPLHKVNNRTQTGNLWFPSASR